jgi:hypothetical protein
LPRDPARQENYKFNKINMINENPQTVNILACRLQLRRTTKRKNTNLTVSHQQGGNKMKSNVKINRNRERPEWVEHLKARYPGSSRPCRHAVTGNVSVPKICALNYECFHCAYDQMLDEPVWMNMVRFNSDSLPVAA